MYAVYRSHPDDHKIRCSALSVMVVGLLGVYISLGAACIEWGGSLLYVGVVILGVVSVILGKSAVEYVYTTPHIKTMRATPLQDRTILMLSEEVAQQFNLPPPDMYITHYEVPNAFTLGRRTHPTLIITDGLLDLTYDEVRAVFAHELAHVRANDSLIKTVASVMQTFLFFDPVARFTYARIYVEKEFVADERSVFVTGNPQDLISALRKIYKEVSEFGDGLPSNAVLNYSQTVYDADSVRFRQGIPADPIVKNRFIVERKMMPGSVVQERVKRLTDIKRRKNLKRVQ
jgi:Zn-dependent protease with chaperone function